MKSESRREREEGVPWRRSEREEERGRPKSSSDTNDSDEKRHIQCVEEAVPTPHEEYPLHPPREHRDNRNDGTERDRHD